MVLKPSASPIKARAILDLDWRETKDEQGKTVWVLGDPGSFSYFLRFWFSSRESPLRYTGIQRKKRGRVRIGGDWVFTLFILS